MRCLIALAALLTVAPAVAAQSGASNTRPGVVAVLGSVLNVADRDRSVAFYTKGLGMAVVMDMGSDKHHETMLGFADDRSKVGIILMSDLTAKTPPVFSHGNAFERMVLRVRDIDGIVARLRSLGHKVGDVRDVAKGYRMAMATDPDGYRLELVESAAKPEKP